MRHGKRFNHLGRTASHRKAMLSNMASSLILHKRISTTVAKAKELRKYVEPLITKSKDDTTHSRRTVFSYLQNKESVRELFDEVAEKIATRPGGYTRIIKMGNRLGDSAEMCIIELVDYNELLLADKSGEAAKKKTRRRGKKSKSGESDTVIEKVESKAKVEESVVEDVPVEEAKQEDEATESDKKVKDKETEKEEVQSVSAESEEAVEDKKKEAPEEEKKKGEDDSEKDE